MNRFIATAILIAVFICIPTSKVEAGQFQTTFRVWYYIGDVEFNPSVPTPPGKKWTLPSALSDWECLITPRFISDDGKSIYHNVVCASISTSVVVGDSIICPLNREGSWSTSFFLRSNEARLSVFGLCATKRNGEQNSPSRL